MDGKRITSAFNDTAILNDPPQESTYLSTLAHSVQPYYRSKAFVSNIGINPLIASTSPIFFLVEKCQQANIVPNLESLHEDLTHEIKAFETHAQTHGYTSQIIFAGRYILCLWADEIILNLQWGQSGGWEKQRLTDQKHNTLDKSFFSLLDHCLQDTATYIDLLELFYLCLSLGYEGEYRYTERGHILLSELRDNLYHRIMHYRGNLSKRLSVSTPTEDNHKISKMPEKSWKPIVAIATSILLLVATTTGYLLMNQTLANELTLQIGLLQNSLL
jgi:type VI secretion system protein ImpK